jgi:hypothetical protein
MKCRVCTKVDIELFYDYGIYPVSHNFLNNPLQNESWPKAALKLYQCQQCGLIQLGETKEIEFYRPIYIWIKQKEPEVHLDDMVEDIISLEGVSHDSAIWGMSYKDRTTLARFKSRGFINTREIDSTQDLGIADEFADIETLQSCITPEVAAKLVNHYGPPKVVICRHILEHANNTMSFIKALKVFASYGAYIVLEIPDSKKSLSRFDYSMLWEEHVLYLTVNSLRTALRWFSLDEVSLKNVSYPYEDCIIIVVKDGTDKLEGNFIHQDSLEDNVLVKTYSEQFPFIKKGVQAFCSGKIDSGKKCAVYGSGHVGCMFINLFEVSEHIEFVVDDDENKIGMYMPGSGLPINPSRDLFDKHIDICFMALNYENENEIKKRYGEFIENGGLFIPISPSSKSGLVTML